MQTGNDCASQPIRICSRDSTDWNAIIVKKPLALFEFGLHHPHRKGSMKPSDKRKEQKRWGKPTADYFVTGRTV